MVVWEVTESLKSRTGGRVKRNAIFAGTDKEVLEDMDCCSVVLLMKNIAVGGKEYEDGSNIWTSAYGKPIDGTNNILV